MSNLLVKLLRKVVDLVIPEPSLEECIKGATCGDPGAQYHLAIYYISGKLVPRDYDRAVELLTASAEAGNPSSQYALGNAYYLCHIGQHKDYVRAYAWFSVYVLCTPRLRSFGEEQRDAVEKLMTPEQISEAQSFSSLIFAKVQAAKNRWRPVA